MLLGSERYLGMFRVMPGHPAAGLPAGTGAGEGETTGDSCPAAGVRARHFVTSIYQISTNSSKN